MIPKRLEEPAWREHVAQLAKTGLSVEEYSARFRVNATRLRWWKARLARTATRTAAAMDSAAQCADREAPSFVRLVVRDPPRAYADGASGAIEVVLRSGELAIRVGREFDAETLVRVLQLVRGAA